MSAETQTQKDTSAARTPQPPTKQFRFGPLSVSIWRTIHENGPLYSVNLQRVYQGEDGKLHNTHSLNGRDVANAALLLTKAHAWMGMDETGIKDAIRRKAKAAAEKAAEEQQAQQESAAENIDYDDVIN